jgi:predicted small integral membrane protein
MTLTWMAWTPATALFFVGIALTLVGMGIWHRLRPSGPPRVGVLGLPTQRGDRLFLSLLGAAFIHLGWVGFAPEGAPLWLASGLALVYAGLVFRFV